jgi:hypothetical protein
MKDNVRDLHQSFELVQNSADVQKIVDRCSGARSCTTSGRVSLLVVSPRRVEIKSQRKCASPYGPKLDL